MKEIKVTYLDGTEKEKLNLEEERKKLSWISKKPLSDEDLLNALNYLTSYYKYELVESKNEEKKRNNK